MRGNWERVRQYCLRALAWSKMNERFIRLNSRQTRFIIFTYNCLVEIGIFTTQTPTCNQRNTCILLCLSILYPWRSWELHHCYHMTSVSLICLFAKECLDGYTRNITSLYMQLFSCRSPLGRRRQLRKFAFQNTKHPRNLSHCSSDSGSVYYQKFILK